MKLEDMPGWAQEIVVDQALGLLQHSEAEVLIESEDRVTILLPSDGFRYTVSRVGNYIR